MVDFFLVEDADRDSFLRNNPGASAYLKQFLSAEEYLNGQNRWVLSLGEAPPQIIRDNPGLRERVEGCVHLEQQARRNGNTAWRGLPDVV